MKRQAQLDATDRKILRELQTHGRISNVELAARVGLSPPPTLRRVQALESQGYITGYRAQVAMQKLGFGVQLFALVGLKSQNEAELKAFEETLSGWPEVREAYAVSGEADFLLRCVGSDLSALQEFIIRTLTAQPNVENVKTTMIMRVSKFEPGVPL
jgi:DNA-binding Lrp family transcriptional regulator